MIYRFCFRAGAALKDRTSDVLTCALDDVWKGGEQLRGSSPLIYIAKLNIHGDQFLKGAAKGARGNSDPREQEYRWRTVCKFPLSGSSSEGPDWPRANSRLIKSKIQN